MPANVEEAVYSNVPAWHGEGVVLDTAGDLGIRVPVALEKSGLDWSVEKVPIFAQDGQVIERNYGVQRDKDQKILGVVGSTWQPVQNQAGFKLIDDLLEESDAFIEAAGALDGGRKVWILAHMPADLFIAGEEVKSYILFTNGHDGRTAVTAAMTDVRVVCQNTLELATSIADAMDTPRIIRVRHTVNAPDRISQAKALLGLRSRYAEEMAKQGEWLVDQTMSDGQFAEFLESLMPITEEQVGKPADTMMRKRRDEVMGVYFDAPTQTGIKGTRWGAYNAVVEYADYRRSFKDTNTQAKAQFTTQPVKQRALQLLLSK